MDAAGRSQPALLMLSFWRPTCALAVSEEVTTLAHWDLTSLDRVKGWVRVTWTQTPLCTPGVWQMNRDLCWLQIMLVPCWCHLGHSGGDLVSDTQLHALPFLESTPLRGHPPVMRRWQHPSHMPWR
jgi:hypothetical protein